MNSYKVIDDLGNEALVTKDMEEQIRILSWEEDSITFLLNNKKHSALIEAYNPASKELTLILDNTKHTLTVKNELDQLIENMGISMEKVVDVGEIYAPMPGLVLRIHVQEGQKVSKDDPIITLEAMKMENLLSAAKDGVVQSVKIQEGASVEKNALLVIID